jgi:hypothetical protein
MSLISDAVLPRMARAPERLELLSPVRPKIVPPTVYVSAPSP